MSDSIIVKAPASKSYGGHCMKTRATGIRYNDKHRGCDCAKVEAHGHCTCSCNGPNECGCTCASCLEARKT